MGGKKCSHPDSRNNTRNSRGNGDSKSFEGDLGTEEVSVAVTRRERLHGEEPWSGGLLQLLPTHLSSAFSLRADIA